MKIGLIGFGSIGQRHFTNLTQSGAGVVIFSARRDVGTLPVVHSWSAFEKQGPYDAVFITNETAKHVATIKKVLSLRPRALFVEKPISHTSAGLERLAKQLREKKISLWVGYNFHFFEPFLKIKKLLASKKVGRILYMRASVGQDLRGWRARDYREIYSSRKKGGGGVLLDLIHDINYPVWILGEPLRPQAAVVRKISALAIDVEDSADSIFSTPSGTVVSVHQDYCRIPGKRSLEVVGEKGSIEWDSVSSTISVADKKGTTTEKVVVERNEMYQAEVRSFLAQVKSKKYFSNLAEAIADVKSIEKIKNYGKK